MEYYPAEIVAVDAETATVRMERTGKLIIFRHREYNAVPPELRVVGAKGYISFPKAPPVFTRENNQDQASRAA
jgi:hypothetical protein